MSIVAPISAAVKSRDNDCSAFVIACYSDPGLHAAREITRDREPQSHTLLALPGEMPVDLHGDLGGANRVRIPVVDAQRHDEVSAFLAIQEQEASWWRDACAAAVRRSPKTPS